MVQGGMIELGVEKHAYEEGSDEAGEYCDKKQNVGGEEEVRVMK